MSTSPAGSGVPERMQQAKRPRSAAAGPYGHPFHPMLVTVPIGAWVAALVFDVVATAGGESELFAGGAYWLILIGIVGALAAAVFGLVDLLAIPRGTKVFKTGLTHMGLNLAAVAIFVVNFLLRLGQGHQEVTALQLILTIVGLGILGGSGWLGGELAYHYGVRVSDETRQAEGYR